MTEAKHPGAPADARPATATTLDVLLLAATGALVAALVHVSFNEFRYRVLDILTWTNREFAWLSPLGYLFCFFLVAVPVVLLARLLPRLIGIRAVAAIFAALTFFSIFLLYQKVHPLAELALATGLGVHLGGVVAAHPARWLRLARRASLTIAVALGMVGLAVGAGSRIGERWHLARLAAADSAAPDVILIILDTVRASSLGVYGYARHNTPVLERLASEGTVFERAFATAPWTAPSHASMMTGLYAGQTRADYLSPMDRSVPTLPEALRAKGYATGGFMANTGYAGYQIGLSRGFAHYEDFPVTFKQALWSTTLSQTESGRRMIEAFEERSRWKAFAAIRNLDLRVIGIRQGERQPASRIADRFFLWRDRLKPGPYFAMLNFMDAHAPYDPPGRFRTMYDSGKREVDRYDGAIAYEDSIIGSIAGRLAASSRLDRTVFIVTSDHGEQWGEHDLESHGNSLYLPLLHVPLIVRAPGRVPAGTRVAPIVSLRDLAATILDLAGVPAGGIPGASLANAWKTGSNSGLSPVVAEVSRGINASPKNPTSRGAMKSSLDSSWHYIRYGDGAEELFAWRSDSNELNNLATAPQGPAEIARQRAIISRTLGIVWPGQN